MKKHSVLQDLDRNVLSQETRRTPTRAREGGIAGSASTCQKDTFSLKKTPKTSNCGTEAESRDEPVTEATKGKEGKEGKKKPFVTTRRSRKRAAAVRPETSSTQLNKSTQVGVPSGQEGHEGPKTDPHKTDKESHRESEKQSQSVTSKERSSSRTPTRVDETGDAPNTNVASSIPASVSLESANRHHKNDGGISRPQPESLNDRKSDAVPPGDDMDCASDGSSLMNSENSSDSRNPAAAADPSPKNRTQKVAPSSRADQPLATSPQKHNEKYVPEVDCRFCSDKTMRVPDGMWNSLSKEQIDALKYQPADNENVLNLLMTSEAKTSRRFGGSVFVGAEIGGDRLQRSESLDESEITSSTVRELKRQQRKELTRSIIHNHAAGQTWTNMTPAVQRYHPFKNVRCRVVGDLPLAVGGRVEEWSLPDDEIESTTSILFQQEGKYYIHPSVPPGWNILCHNDERTVRYVRPDDRETPTCPVELPSKMQAKTFRIARVGKLGRNAVEVAFAPNTQSFGRLGIPRHSPNKRKQRDSTWVTSTSALSRQDGFLQKAATRTPSGTVKRRLQRESPPFSPAFDPENEVFQNQRPNRQWDAESNSLDSSMSNVLHRDGPDDALFKKRPCAESQLRKSKKSKQKFESNLDWLVQSSNDEFLCNTLHNLRTTGSRNLQSHAATSYSTDSHPAAPRSRYQKAKDLATNEVRVQICTGESPTIANDTKLIQDETTFADDSPHGRAKMFRNIVRQESSPSASESKVIDSISMTPTIPILLQKNESSMPIQDQGLGSTARRFQRLKLATPASANEATATIVYTESKPASSTGETGRSAAKAQQSYGRTFNTGLTPKLEAFRLGPPRRNIGIQSEDRNKESPNPSSRGDHMAMYANGVPPSDMFLHAGLNVRNHGGTPETQTNCHNVFRSPSTPFLKHGIRTPSEPMKARSHKDQKLLSGAPESKSLQQPTEEVLYEVVGVSTQSRSHKKTSDRIKLASPKPVQTQLHGKSSDCILPTLHKHEKYSVGKSKAQHSVNESYISDSESIASDEFSPLAQQRVPNKPGSPIKTSQVSRQRDIHQVQKDESLHHAIESNMNDSESVASDELSPLAEQNVLNSHASSRMYPTVRQNQNDKARKDESLYTTVDSNTNESESVDSDELSPRVQKRAPNNQPSLCGTLDTMASAASSCGSNQSFPAVEPKENHNDQFSQAGEECGVEADNEELSYCVTPEHSAKPTPPYHLHGTGRTSTSSQGRNSGTFKEHGLVAGCTTKHRSPCNGHGDDLEMTRDINEHVDEDDSSIVIESKSDLGKHDSHDALRVHEGHISTQTTEPNDDNTNPIVAETGKSPEGTSTRSYGSSGKEMIHQLCRGREESARIERIKSQSSPVDDVTFVATDHISAAPSSCMSLQSGQPLAKSQEFTEENMATERESVMLDPSDKECDDDSVDFGVADHEASDEESLGSIRRPSPQREGTCDAMSSGSVSTQVTAETKHMTPKSRFSEYRPVQLVCHPRHEAEESEQEAGDWRSEMPRTNSQPLQRDPKKYWSWRILNPPHPICSLQNLELLSIRRRRGRRRKKTGPARPGHRKLKIYQRTRRQRTPRD